jgi:hypothetical protein
LSFLRDLLDLERERGAAAMSEPAAGERKPKAHRENSLTSPPAPSAFAIAPLVAPPDTVAGPASGRDRWTTILEQGQPPQGCRQASGFVRQEPALLLRLWATITCAQASIAIWAL